MNKRIKSDRRQSAFTLIELVITLSVLSILIGWGWPSLQQMIRNNQTSAQSYDLIALLHFAKSEAIRRNEIVPIQLSTGSNQWGAIVEDPSEEADIEGCVPGQLRCLSNTNVALVTNSTELNFNNRGYIREADDSWTPETLFLQHENCSGQNQRRRIDITPTGQISSCRLPCNSTATCPL